MTDENIKGLLAKAWKDEAIDLEPGRYFCDEVLTVRVTGTVEKKDDEFAAPTVSIPLIPTLALFWEKCGVTRDYALRMLREAITEAMLDGVKEDDHIQSHIKDVEAAIKAVRTDLIDRTAQDAAGRQGHHQGSHGHRHLLRRKRPSSPSHDLTPPKGV